MSKPFVLIQNTVFKRAFVLTFPAFSLVALAACGGETLNGSSSGAPSVNDAGNSPDSSTQPDANADAGKDGGKLGGPEDCDMPASLPDHPEAKPCVDRPGAPCVPGGWFCLAKWTPYWSDKDPYSCISSFDFGSPNKKLVWLDAYQLDAYEVTNEAYQEYRVRLQSPAPPDLCDDHIMILDPEMPPKELREPSGWDQGRPKPDRLTYPVACLNRGTASDFCKERGGRLPTALEHMRAGQRPAPSLQRFPWGNEVPHAPGISVCSLKPGFSPSPNVTTGPVDAFPSDKGPYGHYALVTNVGEWLSTCREELDAPSLVSASPSVILPSKAKAVCDQSVLIGGYLNRSSVAQNLAEVVLDSKNRAQNVTQVGNRSFGYGYGSAGFWESGPGANGFASNRVGFRCAYDLP
jgi:formylglycine-generating enzyme required for sulfatase activity